VPAGKDIAFYNEAVQLFTKHQDDNKELLIKISQCQTEKGNIQNSKQEWTAAVKSFVKAWETKEKYNYMTNQIGYKTLDISLLRKIADVCMMAR
jgi:hypothetical protein